MVVKREILMTQVKYGIKYGTIGKGRQQRKEKTQAGGDTGRVSLTRRLHHTQRLGLSKGKKMILR